MDVPFYSQRDLATDGADLGPPPPGATWAERSCAIACLTMVLNHYGRDTSMVKVLSSALEHGAFDPARGWHHSGLVQVAQSFGLIAYRRNWRLLDGHEKEYLCGRGASFATRRELDLVRTEMAREGLWTINRLLAAGIPVIASVYRPWNDRTGVGHQVVLTAVDDESVLYHDPAESQGADLMCDRNLFATNWKGTAIVAVEDVIPSRG